MTTSGPIEITAHLQRRAKLHLANSDPVMANLVSTHGTCQIVGQDLNHFQTLATSIISQQLSAKASDTIERRVLSLVTSFSPENFRGVSVESLRSTGLSSPKARYILELARRIEENEINFELLAREDDETAIAKLIELPGIGRWTAEMFLIFGLKRPNVLALGDAGLQRAVRLLYGHRRKLHTVAKAWQPYCSIASWYLWRHLDAE